MSAEHRPRFSWRFLLPNYWFTWFVIAVVGSVMWWPERMKQGFARWLASSVIAKHLKRSRIVDLNLAWCFADKDEQERNAMAASFYYYATRVMLDYGLLWFARPRRLARRIEIRGLEHLQQKSGGAKRTILLTCHSLALEYGALMITRHYPTVGLIKPARNALLEWLIASGRTRFQGHLFERDTGIRHIVRAVKDGMMFYYLPDEDLGQIRQTVFAPFFGVPASTLTSLGRLSRLCDAQVVPCYTRLDESSGKYVLEFYPPLADFPGNDEVADAGRMNQILEAMIRTAPTQYMWSLRIFQTRPANAPSPYETNDASGCGNK